MTCTLACLKRTAKQQQSFDDNCAEHLHACNHFMHESEGRPSQNQLQQSAATGADTETQTQHSTTPASAHDDTTRGNSGAQQHGHGHRSDGDGDSERNTHGTDREKRGRQTGTESALRPSPTAKKERWDIEREDRDRGNPVSTEAVLVLVCWPPSADNRDLPPNLHRFAAARQKLQNPDNRTPRIRPCWLARVGLGSDTRPLCRYELLFTFGSSASGMTWPAAQCPWSPWASPAYP